VVRVEVHLRVGVLWLVVVVDLPFVMLSWHDLGIVATLVHWLVGGVVVLSVAVVSGHVSVDIAVGISVMDSLTVVSVTDWVDLSHLNDWLLMAVDFVLVLVHSGVVTGGNMVDILMDGWLMVLVVGAVLDWVVLSVALPVSLDLLIVVVTALVVLVLFVRVVSGLLVVLIVFSVVIAVLS